MEDQPADSGDLTTGKSASRRRHRMPLAAERTALREETEADDATVEEPEAESVEEIEEVAPEEPDSPEEPAAAESSVAEEPAVAPKVEKPRRRWRFPWQRRTEEAAAEVPATEVPAAEVDDAEEPAETVAENEPSAEARPQRRTPVGKGRRGVVAVTEEPIETNEVTESAAETSEIEASDVADAEGTDEESAAEDVSDEPEQDAEAEPVLVPYRPAGKRLTYAAVGAAAVFVATGAFAGAMMQPYLADRALVDTKLEVAQTSADAITTLWTYTPDNIESLPDRADRYLSRDFAEQYRTFIDSIVSTNKQAQISNDTQVMGTAVESLGANDATAIVYTNSVSTSPVTKNIPSLRYLSYRLTLERRDGDWLITRMPALTQLDLSPQL